MTNQGRNAIDTLLAESLKELTIKQPIEKITIKEITDKAGVIRPTFYNHFQDKYELLEWIIRTELLEPVKPLIQNGMIDQALIIIFAGIEKEKDFYTLEEIEDEFIWEIQMILYNLLVYKTNKKEMEYET